jgi:hypothetical protein
MAVNGGRYRPSLAIGTVIYVRYSRWVENGVIARLFEEIAKHDLIKNAANHVSLDSTSVKVHPDAAGALKKWQAVNRQVNGWTNNENSYVGNK